MDNTCTAEAGVGPVTVKRNDSCIGQDDPITLDVLNKADDPICLNGKCYSLKSLKRVLQNKPLDPISRRQVKDPEKILGLEVDDDNIIGNLRNRNIVRSNRNEQEARQRANEIREETIESLMSVPLPTNKRDKLRELMRRRLELEELNLNIESLIRDAIEADDLIYNNQLRDAEQETERRNNATQTLLEFSQQIIGGKVKKTRRKQHRKNKMTKRFKKKSKKSKKTRKK